MENNQDETTVQPEPSRRISWFGIGLLISGIGAVIFIAAFGIAVSHFLKFDEQIAKGMLLLDQRINSFQTSLTQSQQEAQQSNDELKKSLEEVRQAQSGNNETWRINEAQYYVKLADANLQFENHVDVAIQLLQAADQTIGTLNNPKLDPIRKALADDIVSLQNVPNVDYTGLYLKLAAVNDQLDKLPMFVRRPENVALTSTQNADEAWWKRGLQDTWQMLQKIVVIRYNTSGEPPLISPEQHDFLLQNLHAILEKSMWALLNKQAEIYKSSLQQATQWVNQYFMTNSPLTQTALTNLNELQQVDIHPAAPKITATLQAFHDYLASGNK